MIHELLALLLNMQSVLYLFATLLGAGLFILVFLKNPDYLTYVLGFLILSYIPLLFKNLRRSNDEAGGH